jgi:hypothetical protein
MWLIRAMQSVCAAVHLLRPKPIVDEVHGAETDVAAR